MNEDAMAPAAPSRPRGLADAVGTQSGDATASMNEATPEEQAMYDRVVRNGLEMIEAAEQRVHESLTASENPVMNLAVTTVTIVTALVASAKQAGQPVPGDVLFPAAAEIMEALVEEAEAIKAHDYSEEDMERAMFLAADMYRRQAKEAGMLDEEALKADFAMLEQAEKEGRLDDVLPGARERAEQIAAQQPQPEQPAMEEQV